MAVRSTETPRCICGTGMRCMLLRAYAAAIRSVLKESRLSHDSDVRRDLSCCVTAYLHFADIRFAVSLLRISDLPGVEELSRSLAFWGPPAMPKISSNKFHRFYEAAVTTCSLTRCFPKASVVSLVRIISGFQRIA